MKHSEFIQRVITPLLDIPDNQNFDIGILFVPELMIDNNNNELTAMGQVDFFIYDLEDVVSILCRLCSNILIRTKDYQWCYTPVKKRSMFQKTDLKQEAFNMVNTCLGNPSYCTVKHELLDNAGLVIVPEDYIGKETGDITFVVLVTGTSIEGLQIRGYIPLYSVPDEMQVYKQSDLMSIDSFYKTESRIKPNEWLGIPQRLSVAAIKNGMYPKYIPNISQDNPNEHLLMFGNIWNKLGVENIVPFIYNTPNNFENIPELTGKRVVSVNFDTDNFVSYKTY